MNKCLFVGRLTADPELNDSRTMVTFTLAIDKRYKKDGGATADFARFKAFNRGKYEMAIYIGEWLKKGNLVEIESHYFSDTYDNADGKKVYYNEFQVDEFKSLQTKSDDSSYGSGNSGKVPSNMKEIKEDMPF